MTAMLIEILENGAVANTIVATPEFAEAHYPGAWQIAAVQPKDVAPAAPQACTPAQGLVALYVLKGITEADLQAAVDGVTDPMTRYTAKIGFSRATEWRRDSQTVELLANIIPLTQDELDQLFAFAPTVAV